MLLEVDMARIRTGKSVISISWPPVEDVGEAVDTDGEDTCLQRGRCCCFSTAILEEAEDEATVDGEIGDEESCNSLA